LKDWLIHELTEHYDVPEKLANAWIESQSIIPLLDGLDEVRDPHQEACVDAINKFRRDYGLLPIAVCSRTANYGLLTAKLHLPAAIAIRPLNAAQVQEFLAAAGDRLEGLRNAAMRDPAWWGLLDTPLMLSIAVLVYERGPAGRKIASPQSDIGREQLFCAYVEAMFSRHARRAGYSRDESVKWLGWLASSLLRLGQSVFNLETLNKTWLPTKTDRRLVRMGFAAIVPIIVAPVFSTVTASLALAAAPSSLFAILAPGLVAAGLEVGGLLGLAYGSLVGLCLALGDALDGYAPVDKVRWSWATVKKHILYAIDGSFLCGPYAALMYALNEGFAPTEIAVRRHPYEGVRRSGKNALITGFMQGAVVGFVLGLLEELLNFGVGRGEPLKPLTGGLVLGLAMAPLFGIEKGGGFWVRHWVIRLLLWHRRYAPLTYLRFLDYACECVFLRRVGGGYVFVHRMLLEYFASQGTNATKN
jgi:hypothetical protein